MYTLFHSKRNIPRDRKLINISNKKAFPVFAIPCGSCVLEAPNLDSVKISVSQLSGRGPLLSSVQSFWVAKIVFLPVVYVTNYQRL